MSPSLFIIAVVVLSRGVKNMFSLQISRPFVLSRGRPLISHLFYADDTLIFTNGSKSSLKEFKKFMDSYQASSGQRIN
ncbi:hypothetical protein PJP08_29365 [Mycobacterium kansasii]